MPQRAPTVCRHPGCSRKVVGARYCEPHTPQWKPWGAGARGARTVKGAAYDAARKALFAREPLCRSCAAVGRVTAATIRDHIKPLSQGGLDVESNTQPLCTACHDAKSEQEKRQGSKDSWRSYRDAASGVDRSNRDRGPLL